jgi:hypothetical protein
LTKLATLGSSSTWMAINWSFAARSVLSPSRCVYSKGSAMSLSYFAMTSTGE